MLRSVVSRVAVQVAAGVILGALGTMVTVGLAAAYGPARRNLRIQPAEALRVE